MTKQLMLIPLLSSIHHLLQLLLSQPFGQCLRKIPAQIMNNMSALDEALDILPFKINRVIAMANKEHRRLPQVRC